jgi:peptidyl-prolyl cis-trans isomerase B (cyclophilin B)
MGPTYRAPPSPDYNTFAVLSPIFAVVVPPAGVVLGHLALPQIRRTNERGRRAAIAGLVIGYLMCVVLIAALIWWLTSDSGSDTTTASISPTASTYQVPSPTRPRVSTVTSVAPPSTAPRIKLDLATVPIGTCVEIQLRSDEGNDALDLFKVDCEHKEGVYTVTARVSADYECRSVYVAAPPDHSFALCLNPY